MIHLKIFSFLIVIATLNISLVHAGVQKSDEELFPPWFNGLVENTCEPRYPGENTLVHLNFVSREFNNPINIRYNRFIFPDIKTCEDNLNSTNKVVIDGTELSCGFFASHNGVYNYQWGIISKRGIGAGGLAGLFSSKNECEGILQNPVANQRLWYCKKFNSDFVIATINASYFPAGSNVYPELSKFKSKTECESEMIKLKNQCDQNPNFYKCK